MLSHTIAAKIFIENLLPWDRVKGIYVDCLLHRDSYKISTYVLGGRWLQCTYALMISDDIEQQQQKFVMVSEKKNC